MSTETEIKIRASDRTDFIERLNTLSAREVAPRHFEDNYVLDFPELGLCSRSCLLRVRITEAESFLTYKGPPRP